jgi:hypothetical protein
MNKDLIKRAVALFPRNDCTPESAVRHARIEWLKKVAYLRERGIWILDQPVMRQ